MSRNLPLLPYFEEGAGRTALHQRCRSWCRCSSILPWSRDATILRTGFVNLMKRYDTSASTSVGTTSKNSVRMPFSIHTIFSISILSRIKISTDDRQRKFISQLLLIIILLEEFYITDIYIHICINIYTYFSNFFNKLIYTKFFIY